MEIVDALKEKKLLIGRKAVQQNLLLDAVKEIFLSANCQKDLKNEIKALAEIARLPVTELAQTSEEIGAICKKSFIISVAAVKKTKEQI